MHWVIVGAGYTGMRLAARLARRHTVTVTRRSQRGLDDVFAAIAAIAGPTDHDLAQAAAPAHLALPMPASPRAVDPEAQVRLANVRGVVVDLADRATLDTLPTGDVIVICAPPGPDPEAEIRSLLRTLRAPPRVVYVGSTGVYGPAGGAWVDETFPTAPTSTSGQLRLRAEQALVAANLPSLAILRCAGIYGPDRSLATRVRDLNFRVPGDGASHVCRIHVDDLVEILVRAGNALDVTGVINVADDDPTPIGVVADAVATSLGLPPPDRVPAEALSPESAAMLLADRKIRNDRLAELEVELRYPSWKDGLLG